jgi:SAM-dependent methyltransferase
VVRDYAEYLRLQREEYLSHESEVPRWVEGQRRFVEEVFASLPRTSRVLDCGCGDGVGLEALRRLGFQRLAGVELSGRKAGRARALGFPVEERDMHDLSVLGEGTFDAVLCSHSLEHAYDAARVLGEIRRLLATSGLLHLVLPYPDPGPRNERAHAAKYELGTHVADGGDTVARFIARQGFEVVVRRQDDFREPELWIVARRVW